MFLYTMQSSANQQSRHQLCNAEMREKVEAGKAQVAQG